MSDSSKSMLIRFLIATKNFIIATAIVVVAISVPAVSNYVTLYAGIHNKALSDFLANSVLRDPCSAEDKIMGCDELRALPKVLQGKKIIFEKDTVVEFERYSPFLDEDFSHADIQGFISISFNPLSSGEFVGPNSQKRGFLRDREYRIIRAVYHYNCSYCIDSEDYAHVVLEDSFENRFIAFLDDRDSSFVPAKKIPWDEQLPFNTTFQGWRLENQ